MKDLLGITSQGLFQPQVQHACDKIDLQVDIKVQNYLINCFNNNIQNYHLLSLEFGVSFLDCIYNKDEVGLISLADSGVIVAGCFPHRLDIGYVIDFSILAYEYAIKIMLENHQEVHIKLNNHVVDMVDILLAINHNSKLSCQEIHALLERNSSYAKKLILPSK